MSNHVVRAIALGMIALSGLWPADGSALDHDNLDPNRPIGMEDAYAIPKGEIGMEGGVRFNDRREGRTRVTFQPQIMYGALDNTQIELQGDLMSDPETVVGGNKSGDLHLGVLYNFNTETLQLPAFAARESVTSHTACACRAAPRPRRPIAGDDGLSVAAPPGLPFPDWGGD